MCCGTTESTSLYAGGLESAQELLEDEAGSRWLAVRGKGSISAKALAATRLFWGGSARVSENVPGSERGDADAGCEESAAAAREVDMK